MSLAATDNSPRLWNFRVWLDQRPIGYHSFAVDDTGEHRVLRTEAQFDVRILFINAYSYRHTNTEWWDGDRLLRIEADTDANGTRTAVRGRRVDDRFVVERPTARDDLPADLMSFAYWNPAILQQTRLLNSQTGEYAAVQVVDRGACSVAYAGQTLAARRYDLMVDNTPITVWYGATDNRWLALESPAKGGRMLRYEPLTLPD
jgi:hypothetical protein